jgi:23S rRNA (pseudouridine1915-N3)-methyltransferase
MRIRLIWEGRTKNEFLRALQADYAARIAHFGDIEIEEMNSHRAPRPGGKSGLSSVERHLLDRLQDSRKVVLDQRGEEWTSEEFARWLGECAVRGTRELAFLVGTEEGFSAAFREKAHTLLALSRMTLTRDWARTLLLEQIYRGYTIQRGHPYPR